MVALNQEGETQPLEGQMARLKVIVEEDRRTVRAGETVFAVSHYRVNPWAQPPTIDVLVTQGASRGQTMLGIYEIAGDRLRVCLAAAGRERPRDFSPQIGSGHVLQELKRASE